MILLDANLLLYAYNASFPQHERARQWLEGVLSGTQPVSMPWATVLAFLRIATHPRAFESPLSPAEALTYAASWLDRRVVALVQPTERHWILLSRLVADTRARGPAVMDARLAALAMEHGTVLWTGPRLPAVSGPSGARSLGRGRLVAALPRASGRRSSCSTSRACPLRK